MKKSLIVLTCLVGIALQGCVSYSQNRLTQANLPTNTLSSNEKPKLYIDVRANYKFNDNPAVSHVNIANLEELIKNSLTESGYFSEVTTRKENASAYATITLQNHEQGSTGLAFLSGLTLFLIPGTYENTLDLSMEFRDENGQKQGRVNSQEAVTSWMHLLLLPATPFVRADTNTIIKQLTQKALEAAIKDGLI